MSEDLDVLNNAIIQAREVLNETTAMVAESINSVIVMHGHVQGQADRMAQVGKRQVDLATLNALQGLLEAKCPSDAQVGDDTKYQPVFQGDDAEALKKTVLKICRQIHKEYGAKKEEEDGK